MDSINKQQPEENHKDLSGIEAGKKIKELTEKATTCFFCTAIETGKPVQVRPMTVQKTDENGNLWFLSASDSHTNEQIKNNSSVQLFFQASEHSGFLNLYGHATISKDKNLIDELWHPLVKTWFTEGKDDPRITVIHVKVREGYYWDNKHGNAVAFVKIALGAVLGKTLDDSIEGGLSF